MKMINELIEMGYKYLFVDKGSRSRFWATKDVPVNLSDESIDFLDVATFEQFRAVDDYEKAVLKIFPKDTFIKLC